MTDGLPLAAAAQASAHTYALGAILLLVVGLRLVDRADPAGRNAPVT